MDGKYRDIFENIENIGYFRYFHFTALDSLMSVETIDAKNIDLQIKNIKNMFFHFYKKQ